MLRIIIDENIPFVKGLLEPYAEVMYMPGAEIGADAVRDADALLVRTRTKCDEALLAGSRCRFIATATIGTDHIDLDYCRRAGITVANAPGCNAPAVAQYVMAAIGATKGIHPGMTIGVVGVGHVGSIVARWARSMGMEVLLNDPPRARREGATDFVSLNRIAQGADVITFHTPMTRVGEDATYHLADSRFFEALRRSPLVINAARGGIVDEQSALKALADGLVSALAVDCWEGEPAINRSLLNAASVATPHIAGYSREGKIRATQMSLDALCDHFGLPQIKVREPLPGPAPDVMDIERVCRSYDILADSERLKSCPDAFERLRNHYDYRHEAKSASHKKC